MAGKEVCKPSFRERIDKQRASPFSRVTMRHRFQCKLVILALSFATICSLQAANAGTAAESSQQSQTAQTQPQQQPNALELYSIDSSYAGDAHVKVRGKRASQDALSNDINIGHRIPLFSQWYLRLGAEYQRFDFGSTGTILPDTLQGISGTVSIEYVEQNFIGAALTLHPGVYFQNEITSRSFDIPIELYSAMKVTEKFYFVLGISAAMFREFPVVPIGGPIWLITDTLRLEGIFPRPSLVWVPSDDWEWRLIGEIIGGGFLSGSTSEQDFGHTPLRCSDS